MLVKRLVAARGRANTKLGGVRPLISKPLDFRHEQHIGLDNLGGGANEHSSGMVTSQSMQAGLNQTGGDLYPLTKVSVEIVNRYCLSDISNTYIHSFLLIRILVSARLLVFVES